jgi:gas vesicle protein
MNSTGKILTALVAGAALGVVAGILFAPDKGSETRKKLKEKGRKLKKDMKEKFREGKEKFEEMSGKMKEKAEEMV